MAKGYKTSQIESTVSSILSDAHSATEELMSELEQWRDNMDDNSMDHLPKYEEVSEVAESLSCAVDTLDVDDLVGELGGFNVEATTVTWEEMRPYGKRSPSRSLRRDNVVSMVDAVVEKFEDQIEALNTAKESLEAFKSEIENVEFPGLYS